MSKCKVWTKGSMGEHSLSMHRQGSGRKFEDWKRRKVFLAWVVTIRLIIMLANWNENFTEIIWISICMRLFNLINFFYWNIQSFYTKAIWEKLYNCNKEMGICHISHCQSICPCSEPFSESTRSIDRLHVVT